MWVFGYGSLIWCDWHGQFGCLRSEQATLEKYRRDFNKASVKRWGSDDKPGPTLGLASSSTESCEGLAFEFEDARRDKLVAYLRKREGKSFCLKELDVVLADGRKVPAIVPVNDVTAKTFIGDQSLEERAELARRARGEAGSCADYVRHIREKLQELGIRDSAVECFWSHVSSTKAGRPTSGCS